MVNTSVFWPVTVYTASFEESITFLEQEVIGNKLFLVSLRHVIQRVVFSLQFSVEFGQGSCNFLLNSCSLLRSVGTGTKREALKISANSDSSGSNHVSFIWREVRSIKLDSGIFSLMHIIFTMTVISFNNRVEKCGEGIVGIVRTSVDTDAGVNIFTSREDCISEWEIIFIFLVSVSLPNITA